MARGSGLPLRSPKETRAHRERRVGKSNFRQYNMCNITHVSATADLIAP